MTKKIKLFDFNNSYVQLPESFYCRCLPTPVSRPHLIAFNYPLACELGLSIENIKNNELAEFFAGNRIPEGAAPLAMAYAGHQFGHFVTQLGDGRSLLLGEVIDTAGIRRDIHFKGSGPTPFSRNGDGRAALGPVIREYIVSEAMHALGIKTTRALAAVTTGEKVYRETERPGAILTRVAASHVRIGTFEYFSAKGDYISVQHLADYVITRHYPEAKKATNPYLALLEFIIEAQAKLVSSWMQIGFIHGVMNTDNMAISGETLDYGPCAFIDEYDPMKSYSAIDSRGRYAFANQPLIAQWNLSRLAETLLPLIDHEMKRAISVVEERLHAFMTRFQHYWLTGMRKKLGLMTEKESDIFLIKTLLDLMHRNQVDYTFVFRLLCENAGNPIQEKIRLQQLFAKQPGLNEWLKQWHDRLNQQPHSLHQVIQTMRNANPVYIPRNHRIEQVIVAAVEQENFLPMQRLAEALSQPYQEREDYAEYALPPLAEERVQQTFCGT